MKIEVIVQNREEAIEAENLGVDRLELVTAIEEDGLTPSFKVMDEVLHAVSIPVQIMIRPHSKSFHYNHEAMEEVLEAIEHVVSSEGNRIVFGALTDEKMIDEAALTNITRAYPSLDITFHKAFDEVKDQLDAYTKLESYPQIQRILTSGGATNCMDGKEQLKILHDVSMERNGPQIMPGAGLNPENMASIHTHVNADQYHFGRAVREQESYNHSFSKQALDTIFRHTKE